MASEALKRAVRLAFRRTRNSRVDPLYYRSMVAKRLRDCDENGTIAVVRQGRDCDGCSYASVEHIPTPSVMAWLKACDHHDSYLDGPCATWLAKPSDEPEGYDELTSQWER